MQRPFDEPSLQLDVGSAAMTTTPPEYERFQRTGRLDSRDGLPADAVSHGGGPRLRRGLAVRGVRWSVRQSGA